MESPSASEPSAEVAAEERELAALRAGDEAAFLALVNRHHGAMLRVASMYVGYVSDAANNALEVGPATTSYIACMLVSTLDGGLVAFEAERAWQARWLAERLGLG